MWTLLSRDTDQMGLSANRLRNKETTMSLNVGSCPLQVELVSREAD